MGAVDGGDSTWRGLAKTETGQRRRMEGIGVQSTVEHVLRSNVRRMGKARGTSA